MLNLSRGIKVTGEDLSAIAKKYGYEFKGNEKAEFTTLLAATCNAMQFVSEMDGPFYLHPRPHP
jgi:amidase